MYTDDRADLVVQCKSLAHMAKLYWEMSWYLGATPGQVQFFQREAAGYYRASRELRLRLLER